MVQNMRPHRHPATATVNVVTSRGQHRVQVMDANTAGAKLLGTPPLRRGEKVKVTVGQQSITAIVRWCGRDRAGISFEPAISDQQLTVFGARGMARQTARWDNSGLREMR